MPSNRSDEKFLKQFNVLLEEYLRSNPKLPDAQNTLRKVIGQMACQIIAKYLIDPALSGGYYPPKPHQGLQLFDDPTLHLAAISLEWKS